MKRFPLLVILLFVSLSAYSQPYQALNNPSSFMISFKSIKYNFDSKKLMFFQPQGLTGAPCIIDSFTANTYRVNSRTLDMYKPFNKMLDRIRCEDYQLEHCWGDEIDIYTVSPNDSNFVIAYQKIQGYPGIGNCVSTSHTAYISYNGGLARSLLFSGNPIYGFDIDPANDNNVYLAMNTYIYKSTNRGLNFSISAGIPTLNGMVKVNWHNPNIIYAAGTTSMHLSTNAGASFTPLPVPPFTDMKFSSNIAYGTAASGVYKSNDFGITWVQVSSIANVNVIEINPNDANILYIGTTNGFYRSLNAGGTFNKSAISFPGSIQPNNIIGISKDINTGDSLYVCTKNKIFKVWDVLTSTQGITLSIPESFLLRQNYPNPFNPSTTVDFDLPSSSVVTVNIYDASGKHISELVNGNLMSGSYSYIWNASAYSSGVYYYKMDARSSSGEYYSKTNKMLLIK